MAQTDNYKVKLVQPNNRAAVYFDVTPDVVETHNVNYQSIDPIHAPGQIMAYVNSASRTYNISNVRMISRTVEEADLNLERLHLLRSWTRPFFGTSTLTDQQRRQRQGELAADAVGRDSARFFDAPSPEERGAELRGAPPHVLLLSAYSRASSVGNTPEHINRVPVVIEQLSFPYPSDTDYINTSTGVPMPTLMSLDMTMKETHSPGEYERFNLFDFRRGTLRNF